MQVNGEDVAIAHGPCNVGVLSSLSKSDVKPGQMVFASPHWTLLKFLNSAANSRDVKNGPPIPAEGKLRKQK